MSVIKFLVTVFCAGLIIAKDAAIAQTGPQIGTTPIAQFEELVRGMEVTFNALPPVAPAPGTLLINGALVDPKFFPTVFQMTTGGTCTATLVGEATLLLAAHCVADRALIKFALANREIRGICERARGYNPPDKPEWEFPGSAGGQQKFDVSGGPSTKLLIVSRQAHERKFDRWTSMKV
jgi:hypothetical protein